eukprot:2132016-Pyramimonas_sp.AAC.1
MASFLTTPPAMRTSRASNSASASSCSTASCTVPGGWTVQGVSADSQGAPERVRALCLRCAAPRTRHGSRAAGPRSCAPVRPRAARVAQPPDPPAHSLPAAVHQADAQPRWRDDGNSPEEIREIPTRDLFTQGCQLA